MCWPFQWPHSKQNNGIHPAITYKSTQKGFCWEPAVHLPLCQSLSRAISPINPTGQETNFPDGLIFLILGLEFQENPYGITIFTPFWGSVSYQCAPKIEGDSYICKVHDILVTSGIWGVDTGTLLLGYQLKSIWLLGLYRP